jgi:hypothetical protein
MLRSNVSQNRTTKRANREFSRGLRKWDVRELFSANQREVPPEILQTVPRVCSHSRSYRNVRNINYLRVAEGVGFEPTLRFPVNTLSKRAPSATRPPLLIAPVYIKCPTRAVAPTTWLPSELIERREPASAQQSRRAFAFAGGGRLSRGRRRRSL